MGLSVEEAAEGIIKIVNESMFGALRLVSVEQGFDPRDFALVGFGGAGPLHANALGILTQAWPAIIPPGPGVLCAYGDATTQVRDEASRTYVSLLKNIDDGQFRADLQELAQRAKASLEQDGLVAADITLTYQADVRYTGQAFQLSVEFSEAELAQEGKALLQRQFDAEHTQLFTFALEDGHEVVMIRAVATASNQRIPVRKAGNPGATLADCKMTDSEIYYEGRYYPTPIYAREKLHSALTIDGPAIVCEMDSTSVILPGYRATVDHVGNLLINPA